MNEIKSRADLFEAAAKMMRMCDDAGIINITCKIRGVYTSLLHVDLHIVDIDSFEPFLAIVEGKPVFKGDELFSNYLNCKVTVTDSLEDVHGRPCLSVYDAGSYIVSSFSWFPPKPRTVMVELLREDAEWYERNIWHVEVQIRISEACRKALEEQK